MTIDNFLARGEYIALYLLNMKNKITFLPFSVKLGSQGTEYISGSEILKVCIHILKQVLSKLPTQLNEKYCVMF